MSNTNLSIHSLSPCIENYTDEPALFCLVIDALQKANHNLCILHGYKSYPEKICSTSDIDAISESPAQIPHILSKAGIAKVVQVLQHEATAFSYTLYIHNSDKPTLILLDVSIDYRRNGRIFFTGEEFLQSSQLFKFFQVPSTELEFAYYIIKKIAKAHLTDEHAQRLSELYRKDPALCRTQLKKFFPKQEIEIITESADSGDWKPVQKQIQTLRQSLLRNVGRQNTLKVLNYWLDDLKRKIRRILQPTGIMIVVLGADGSGKSTVINQVSTDLAPAFRQNQYIHLRPRLGHKTTANEMPVVDPHGQPPRSWLISIFKLIYFLCDYIAGYLLKVYPQLIRSTFVVFDRYYHDLLVDSKRYRYSGPIWWAKLIGKLIPKPDLWILLDAPPEVLQSRKQEVSFEETARQREAYIKLVSSFSNGVIVDASQPLEKVVTDVDKTILDFMTKRAKTRLKL